MRIGSRRLIWALNLLLLMAAAVIFRPLRSWIDQVMIARSIHPNLSVQEIHLHANRLEKGLSIVEAKQFDWGSSSGNRRFGISAERAWIVVENAPLIDKKVLVPKAVLEHSRLYLETIAPDNRVALRTDSMQDSRSAWQHQLKTRFGDIEWNDLKQHVDGVLRLDDFNKDFGSKVDAWIGTNQRIADQAKQISSGDSLGNPLRDNSELKSRIGQVEKLINTESDLRKQFATLKGEVDKKLHQIGSTFDTHVDIVKEKAAIHQQSTARRLAEQLLLQTGDRTFAQFQSFAEVADRLCRATAIKHGYGTDEDYRISSKPIVSLENIAASGVFGGSNFKSPFRMQSTCNFSTKIPFGVESRTNFRYQFDLPGQSIRLAAYSRLEQQNVTDLQMAIQPRTTLAMNPADDALADIVIGQAQWVVSSNGNSITGELYLDRNLLPMLVDENSQLAAAVERSIEAVELSGQAVQYPTLMMGGTWESASWSMADSEPPVWLLRAIESLVEDQVRDSEQQMIAKLETHITSEIERLAAQLNQRLEQAKLRSDVCSKELLASHSMLTNQLTSESNTEFARTQPEDVKR